jgi:hypothetical protein
VREISFVVDGYPPAKNEAKSMLAEGLVFADRVRDLLITAAAVLVGAPEPLFPTERLGLELELTAPTTPPSDATTYLGGVGDVLEAKTRRGLLQHLGERATVAIYENDRQIEGALPLSTRRRGRVPDPGLGPRRRIASVFSGRRRRRGGHRSFHRLQLLLTADADTAPNVR